MKEKIPEYTVAGGILYWMAVAKERSSVLRATPSAGCSRRLSALQALLLGVGLQHKSVDQLEKEIELPSGQLMGLFNRIIRKVVKVTLAEAQGRVLVCFR